MIKRLVEEGFDRKLIGYMLECGLVAINENDKLCFSILDREFRVVGCEIFKDSKQSIHDKDWGFNFYNTNTPKNLFVFSGIKDLLTFASLSSADNFFSSCNKSLYLSMDGFSEKMINKFVDRFRPENIFICIANPTEEVMKLIRNKRYIWLRPKNNYEWLELLNMDVKNIRSMIQQEII